MDGRWMHGLMHGMDGCMDIWNGWLADAWMEGGCMHGIEWMHTWMAGGCMDGWMEQGRI